LDHKIIYIRLSPGRSMRLLINLKHWVLPNFHGVRSLRTLQEGFSTGALEYVDALEEPSLSIAYSLDDLLRRTALGEQFSHMEVDPSWYFGVTAGSLPFSNHDPTPRGLLGSAMAKQTFTAAINPNRLQHMQQLNLEYPMKPLCDTRMLQDLGVWWHGSGHMVKFVVVATDFDIEDSTDKNKGATERGLHRTTITRRYSAAIKPQLSNSGDRTNDVKKVEVFENPNKQETIGIQYANYNKIQKNGLPLTGTSLQKNDIVIGKTIREWKPHQSEEPKKRDDSICIKEDSGVVQSVKSVQVGDGSRYQFKEVTLRTECLNETGDKFYTRYGQKGTIGIDRVESDCYFSVVSGVPATIHFSPIGLLARMTDGLVQEIERSNAAAIVGKYVNATAFLSSAQKQKQIDVVSVLLAHGAQQMSYEVFVDGKTGELTQPLLTGLCYMCPLAHLVANKIHARDGGPVQFITRQPEEGRSRDGGLRFGQMEMDAMNALGAANTVAEKLTKGDSLKIGNCQKCGTSVRYNKQKSLKMCKVCGTGKHIVETTISFALKTCIQEIQSMGIRAQLIVSPDEFDSSRTQSSTSNAANSDESEYYNQSLEPEPEAWEFEKYGIPKPKNLKDLLNLS
jgi:DNA-directed RNA polymerase beta subunit